MPETDIPLREDRDSIRIPTLDRPRRPNALNGALVEAICGAVRAPTETTRSPASCCRAMSAHSRPGLT